MKHTRNDYSYWWSKPLTEQVNSGDWNYHRHYGKAYHSTSGWTYYNVNRSHREDGRCDSQDRNPLLFFRLYGREYGATYHRNLYSLMRARK